MLKSTRVNKANQTRSAAAKPRLNFSLVLVSCLSTLESLTSGGQLIRVPRVCFSAAKTRSNFSNHAQQLSIALKPLVDARQLLNFARQMLNHD